jgi:RNA polymerase sigma factor (sigma-70 family)
MRPAVDDIAMFKGLQRRDPCCEKAVFHRFFRPLCLYAERITGDLPAAEDVVVEALAVCLNRRQEFKALENVKAFLYRAVHNASVNHSVAERRHRTAHANIAYLHHQHAIQADPLENEILRAELLREIYEEIENLPGRCQEIFRLLFIHGLTTDQVADRLSIHSQTVRSQKARALSLIKNELFKKGRILALLLLMTRV